MIEKQAILYAYENANCNNVCDIDFVKNKVQSAMEIVL